MAVTFKIWKWLEKAMNDRCFGCLYKERLTIFRDFHQHDLSSSTQLYLLMPVIIIKNYSKGLIKLKVSVLQHMNMQILF